VNKRYHLLRISAFIHVTEDEEKVMGSLQNLMGEELPDDIEVIETEGFHHNPIKYIVLDLTRSRDIKRVLTRWEGCEFWTKAKYNIDERLDDDLTYHVRIDKDRACQGELVLWKGGEAIDVQLKPATFPASREGAKEIILRGP
jgi:RNA binding exosome subunit